MFRIEVDVKGSTRIYCSSTGKLLCIIDDKKVPPKHKPVVAVHPIPRQTENLDPNTRQQLDAASTSKVVKVGITRLNPKNIQVGESKRNVVCKGGMSHSSEDSFRLTTSNPTKELNEINKDYSEDCIVQDEFLSTLGLISKKQMNTTPLEKLKSEFPYRNISRVIPSESQPIPWQTKFYYEVEMCSPLTQKFLSENLLSPKYLLRTKQEISAALNKNAHYLKAELPCADEQSNLPKLRCRDINLYPLTYKVSKDWKYLRHMYSFNKKQRQERVRIIETGLDKEGRKLFNLCQPVTVDIKKLDPRTIRKWTVRRPPPLPLDIKQVCVQAFLEEKPIGAPFISKVSNHPGIVSMIQQPERYQHVTSHFLHPLTNTAIPPSRPKMSSVLLPKNLNKLFSCRVVLHNVLHRLRQRSHICYVENSPVSVRDVAVLPLKLWQPNRRTMRVNLHPNRTVTMPDGNTAIHKKSTLSIHHMENSRSTVQIPKFPMANKPLPLKASPYVNGSKDIPLIDITSDDDEEVPKAMPTKGGPPSSIFLCYGCNLRQHFNTKEQLDSFVHKHMVEYHSVAQPSHFLKMGSLQPAPNIIVEAFPGFKQLE